MIPHERVQAWVRPRLPPWCEMDGWEIRMRSERAVRPLTRFADAVGPYHEKCFRRPAAGALGFLLVVTLLTIAWGTLDLLADLPPAFDQLGSGGLETGGTDEPTMGVVEAVVNLVVVLVGAVAAILLLLWVGVLLILPELVVHETSHAIACRRVGVDVESVGLIVHGVLPMAGYIEPEEGHVSASDMRYIAASGPFASMLHGGLWMGIGWLTGLDPVSWLGAAYVFFGAFNGLPVARNADGGLFWRSVIDDWWGFDPEFHGTY